MAEPAYFAVIPAAGVGRRMAGDGPKQYLTIAGKTILEHTLITLLKEPRLQKLVVVVGREDDRWQQLAVFNDPRVATVEGGAERCHSVLNGLNFLQESSAVQDWVLVHDVARPCIQLADIDHLITALADGEDGGLLAIPVTDTLKQLDSQRRVTATLDRSRLWQAQTPQMFRYGLLRQALAEGIAKGLRITDEASAIEQMGGTVTVVEGCRSNIKVTRPEDLALAEFYLSDA
jgi:2-C-methyl-D-erythritol 4-phosphate cytidylyltransferase